MDYTMNRLIVEPFEDFISRLLQFLPNLLLAIFVLAVGIALAAIARVVLRKLLEVVGLDKAAQKWGIMELLGKGGVKGSFSSVIGKLVFWLIFVMFLVMSLDTLSVPEGNTLLSRFFLYLPNILVAAAIIIVGYITSHFLGKAVLVWAVNSNLGMAGFIGKAVKVAIILLALTMALEQLGIGPTTVLILFSLLFGGVVLGLSIAFGLGGKDLAKDFLERRLKGDAGKKDEIQHL